MTRLRCSFCSEMVPLVWFLIHRRRRHAFEYSQELLWHPEDPERHAGLKK